MQLSQTLATIGHAFAHHTNLEGDALVKMARMRPEMAMSHILASGDVEGSLRALRAFPDALTKLRRADNAPVRTKQQIEDILLEVGIKWLT